MATFWLSDLLKCHPSRLVFDLSRLSHQKPTSEHWKSCLSVDSVCCVTNGYYKQRVSSTWIHSVLHPARQTQRRPRLGLGHQGHNGAGGRILDLSYSWGTMGMWLLHRDGLVAPNAISPDKSHVCARMHAARDRKCSQRVLL